MTDQNDERIAVPCAHCGEQIILASHTIRCDACSNITWLDPVAARIAALERDHFVPDRDGDPTPVTWKQEYDHLHASFERMMDQRDELKKRVGELEKLVNAWEEDGKTREQKITSLQKERDEFRGGWTRLKDLAISELPEELFRFKEAVEKAKGRCVETWIYYLSSLWNQRDQAIAENAALRASLDEAKKEIALLVGEINHLRKDKESL